jgi:hypothetical protein
MINKLDPLVNSIITDIIKILISNRYTNAKIEQRIIPTLVSILNTTTISKTEVENTEQKDYSTLITVRYLVLVFFL